MAELKLGTINISAIKAYNMPFRWQPKNSGGSSGGSNTGNWQPPKPNNKDCSINWTAVDDLFGAYCVQNQNEILTEALGMAFDIRNPNGIGAWAGIMTRIRHKIQGRILRIDKVLKPQIDCSFDPDSDKIYLDGWEDQVEKFKADLCICFTELEHNFWANFETVDGVWHEDNTPAFVQYILRGIIEVISLEIRMAFTQGIRNNSGTSYLDIFDGYQKKIQDFVGAGALVPITTGPTTIASNLAVQNMFAVYNGLGANVKARKVCIVIGSNVAADFANMIQNGILQYLGLSSYQQQQNTNFYTLPGYPNVPIYEDPYLNKDAILATTPGNITFLTNSEKDYSDLRVHKQIRHWELALDAAGGTHIKLVNALHAEAIPLAVNDMF